MMNAQSGKVTLDQDEVTNTVSAILIAVNGRDSLVTINALQMVLNMLQGAAYMNQQQSMGGQRVA